MSQHVPYAVRAEGVAGVDVHSIASVQRCIQAAQQAHLWWPVQVDSVSSSSEALLQTLPPPSHPTCIFPISQVPNLCLAGARFADELRHVAFS